MALNHFDTSLDHINGFVQSMPVGTTLVNTAFLLALEIDGVVAAFSSAVGCGGRGVLCSLSVIPNEAIRTVVFKVIMAVSPQM